MQLQNANHIISHARTRLEGIKTINNRETRQSVEAVNTLCANSAREAKRQQVTQNSKVKCNLKLRTSHFVSVRKTIFAERENLQSMHASLPPDNMDSPVQCF